MPEIDSVEQPSPLWLQWVDVMRVVVRLILERNFKEALSEIEKFYPDSIADKEVHSDVLGMMAEVKGELGEFASAKNDLLVARSLLRSSFAKQVHEASLAEICLKQHQKDEALTWYRTSLRTGTEARISCGGTLRRFLALLGQQKLAQEDEILCLEVAEVSWRALGLTGNPDFSNLDNVISAIIAGEANPPRAQR